MAKTLQEILKPELVKSVIARLPKQTAYFENAIQFSMPEGVQCEDGSIVNRNTGVRTRFSGRINMWTLVVEDDPKPDVVVTENR